ncbi:MAG: hypothetical protein R3B06_28640 [Kofleriaceae bacterium]
MRVALLVVALVAGSATVAHAYPRFQLATGASSCAECHLSPTGGGLLNDYGRAEAGDTVSRGGDGTLLHGLWTPPSWLAIGGDLRGAVAARADDADRTVAAFPMQADLAVRAGGHGLTVNLVVGLRGSARAPRPPLVERLASREHFLQYQRGAYYARAGRFFSPLGLRLHDHTAYVRRYLGFGLAEEPYGIGGGVVRGDWEAHLHAFVPNPVGLLGAGPKAKGVAASYERRILDGAAAVGGGLRYAASPDDTRAELDVTGKRWFDDAGLLLLGEVALVRQGFAAVDAPRWQLASYLGASQRLTQGVWLGLAVHRWQPDLGLRSSRDAVEIDLQYFPWAHVELHWTTRATAVGNNLDAPGLLSLAQLHYYL